MYRGIDLSHWNEVNWEILGKQRDTLDFVILKLGTYTNKGFSIDPSFYNNYYSAEKCGYNIGCYIYINGDTYIQNKTCTAYLMETMPYVWGLKFDMPIFLDIEEFPSNEFYGDMVLFMKTWLALMEEARFYVGVYSSYAYFKNYLFPYCHTYIKNYVLWVARWGSIKPEFGQIWQKTSKGQLAGITAYVDVNETNIDYPSTIKKYKLNGFFN